MSSISSGRGACLASGGLAVGLAWGLTVGSGRFGALKEGRCIFFWLGIKFFVFVKLVG
jgi:hypothetical protein